MLGNDVLVSKKFISEANHIDSIESIELDRPPVHRLTNFTDLEKSLFLSVTR